MEKKVVITKICIFDVTKILFNGVVHLAFSYVEVVGFQTWKSNSIYSIELTFRNGAKMVTEYDNRTKWETVISLIQDDFGK